VIASSARVLLLDDPFSQMDGDLRDKCFERTRDWVKNSDRIVIFATGDFAQITALADEAAILFGGEIKQIGTPQNIYEAPESTRTARISGEVHLIKARRLTSTNADLPEFQTIDGGHRILTRPTEKNRLGAINQNMTLAIRPEQISMSMGASFPGDNLVKAIVTGIRFSGPTTIIEFDAGGLRLTTRVFKVVGLTVGDECMLGLPPERIIVLKE